MTTTGEWTLPDLLRRRCCVVAGPAAGSTRAVAATALLPRPSATSTTPRSSTAGAEPEVERCPRARRRPRRPRAVTSPPEVPVTLSAGPRRHPGFAVATARRCCSVRRVPEMTSARLVFWRRATPEVVSVRTVSRTSAVRSLQRGRASTVRQPRHIQRSGVSRGLGG